MRKFAALLLIVAFVCSSAVCAVRAEESNEKGNGELAEALESVKVSLDDALRAGEAQGTPISGKFEIEDGKLQLSIYTIKDGKFFEVIVDIAIPTASDRCSTVSRVSGTCAVELPAVGAGGDSRPQAALAW